MGNQYTSGAFNRLQNVQHILAKYNSDWEYVGGFVNVDLPIKIRCKNCGAVTERSMITIRHGHCRCENCEKIKRLQNPPKKEKKQPTRKQAAKRMTTESKRFNRGVQLGMKFCSCGAPIESSKQFCLECSQRRKNRHNNAKKQKRLRASFTKETAQISVQTLYERDHGICWLCGQPCNLDADPNANDYPSIDHVVPISKGGKDEWKNVRLAHRICNSLRGNRV